MSQGVSSEVYVYNRACVTEFSDTLDYLNLFNINIWIILNHLMLINIRDNGSR